MKQRNYQKGKAGEDIAESYLARNGFQIVEKNFNTRHGEIDLIAIKNKTLHFVEVKLKVGERFGTPEEMVTKRKIMQVMRTADVYLLKNKGIANKFPSIQIDAICIVLDGNGEEERVDYYQNLSAEL